MRTTRTIGRLAAVTCAVMAWAPTAMAINETQVYGIAEFGGSGQCSGGESHAVHTETAAAFLETFTALQASGSWDETATDNNTSARGRYFTDPTQALWCGCSADDTNTDDGIDEADVVYVHTHGYHATGVYNYSALLMGNSGDDCSARTDNNLYLGNGDGDLDIAVIKACQSGDYEVFQNSGYRQQLTSASSTFRMWNAFHGDSSCGSHVTSYVRAYAAESVDEGVGENWLDEAFDENGTEDDCPVSIVIGHSSTVREHLYEHGGWSDRPDLGDKTGSTYFYIGGCNPSHGVALPTG